MIPVSISASSLDVAAKCLAHYKATAIDRGTGMNNPAALLGTTLHLTLENFTENFVQKKPRWDWAYLFECYTDAFKKLWGSDTVDDWFNEGRKILENWFNRPTQFSDLNDVDILSREVKEFFMVPYVDADGTKKEVPFNYIIDRLDQIGDKAYRVVDYKSQRSPLQPEQLRSRIQPRAYALATQIKYRDAEEIWVQYDFLRYERVAMLFTRDDNVETWKHIKGQLQRIIDTPVTNPPETLNENCRYCPRKFVCSALQSNIRIGGIFSLGIDQMALTYYEMKSQMDALKSAVEDLEHQLLTHAVQTDQLNWEGEKYEAKVTSRKTRQVNRDMIAQILGPELMQQYGQLRVGDLDTLRNDDRLTVAQKSLLNEAITYKHSDPSIKVVKK